MNEEDDLSAKKVVTIKVVLIGNSGEGKTCISQRYINDSFTNNEQSTVGASYFQKKLEIDGKSINLDIWDTAGQERYRSMGKMFYKDAFIVLFVYDITDKKSFLELKNVWYDEIKKTGEKHSVLAVVGNKSDLYLKEQVDEDEARKWADDIGAIYALVSAKEGDCINLLFDNVVKKYFSPDFVAQMDSEKKNRGKTNIIEKKDLDSKKKRRFC